MTEPSGIYASMNMMQVEYDARIAALRSRLEAAESRAETAEKVCEAFDNYFIDSEIPTIEIQEAIAAWKKTKT